MIWKITEVAISFSKGFYHIYAETLISTYMGQFELAYVTLYIGTAMVLTLTAFYGAVHVWDTVAEREKEAAEEGIFGVPVSNMDAIKFLTLGLVISIVNYKTVSMMSEQFDSLLGWFDEYDTDQEASHDGKKDYEGTALLEDLQMHAYTTIYYWFLLTFIILGSNMFAMNFFEFKRLEDCNLDDVDESYYEPVRPYIASEVDLASCKAAVKNIFKLADLDHTQRIDRCENAKFLYGMGNTSEYALKYNEVKVLPMLYDFCAHKFPDYMIPPSTD